MHSSKCVVLGFNVWRTGMRQRLKGLTSSGYLYRTQCHRHGTGCIHRKGQRIYRAYKLIERRSASHRIVEGERDANLPSWKFSIEWKSEAFATDPRHWIFDVFHLRFAFNRSVRIKKKRKEYWLSLTFFKNGRVIYAIISASRKN